MKRFLSGLAAGAIAGILAGFALGIFIYPFWFLNDVASEQLSRNEARTLIADGMFLHANPSDPVHWGKGKVALYSEGEDRQAVFLGDDFQVGPGPRFHVYLVARDEVRNAADFKGAEKLDLGRLRAFTGSQIYPVPAGSDTSGYSSVVIWCKEFGVLISPAALRRKRLS